MTLLRLALRSHRVGAIALAWIGAATGLVNAIGYVEIAGHTRPERQVFAKQMEILGQQLTYLLPAPLQLDTMGGYLTWRAFGSVALLFAIWGVLAGAGAARGDEEKGVTEAWLASGISRVRWMLARATGFIGAAGISSAVACAATQVGTQIAGDPTPLGAMALEWLLVLGVTLVGYGIGVIAAQFMVTRRVAGTVGTAALIAVYVLNSASRAGADAGAIRWLSPFYLFDRSAPLLEGGAFDVASTVALYAIGAAFVALATWAFGIRDIGSAVVRRGLERVRTTYRPSSDPLLRIPVIATVDQQRWWIFGWAVGLGVLGYFLTSLVRTMIEALSAIPLMRAYLQALGISAYSDFVGAIWFGTALLLVCAMVVVQANGWAADDAEGRLETVLANGASRPRVTLERIAALLIDVAIVMGVASAIVYFAARAYDIDVPLDRFVLATVLTLPLAYAFAAIGQWLVGWRPRLAVIILGTVAVVSYFIQEFAPLFSWPEWVGHLSLFELYGAPMVRDDWGGIAALVAIGVAGTALSLVSMQRRDVGT